jgi:hypothetical protein
LDIDHRLGALQLPRETFVLAEQQGSRGGKRIERRRLGSALDDLEGVIGTGIAWSAPVGQSRRIEPFPPVDHSATARNSAVAFSQYPKFVGGRECPPPTRTVDQFGRHHSWRWRRDAADVVRGITRSMFHLMPSRVNFRG